MTYGESNGHVTDEDILFDHDTLVSLMDGQKDDLPWQLAKSFISDVA